MSVRKKYGVNAKSIAEKLNFRKRLGYGTGFVEKTSVMIAYEEPLRNIKCGFRRNPVADEVGMAGVGDQ